MIFVALTLLTAFLIEGLGTYVSVIGLSTLFGANPIIIALAIALDMGKLVVVTLLYTYWKKLGKIMKTYAIIASVITMTITSAGAAGYLSGEFQKAILGTQEGALKVDVLKGQISKYEERKKQIDQQIAALPEKTSVNQRIRLINAFKAEQADLQAKISDLDKQLPDLQIKQIGVEAKAGPILYVAKAFDIPVEQAVKWVILLIIFVFDPLAVFLIIAGNFLLHQRKIHKDTNLSDADLFDEAKHGGEFPQERDRVQVVGLGDEYDSTKPTDEFVFAHPHGGESRVETLPTTEVPATPEKPASTQSIIEELHPTELHVPPKDSSPAPDLHFREPEPVRETITLSSLGLVKPDPNTVVDATEVDDEIGFKTGIFKTGHRTK